MAWSGSFYPKCWWQVTVKQAHTISECKEVCTKKLGVKNKKWKEIHSFNKVLYSFRTYLVITNTTVLQAVPEDSANITTPVFCFPFPDPFNRRSTVAQCDGHCWCDLPPLLNFLNVMTICRLRVSPMIFLPPLAKALYSVADFMPLITQNVNEKLALMTTVRASLFGTFLQGGRLL